jgi:membrane fusion protein, multidrug efflux system
VVEADLTPLSAQVAGRISAVLVNDLQRVHEGELLAQIDDPPFRAQLAQADASVAAAEAAIANLKAQEVLQAANIAAAQAQLDGNRATEVRDRLEAERQRRLLATKVVGTRQAVEQADAAEKLAQALVMAAGAALAAAQSAVPAVYGSSRGAGGGSVLCRSCLPDGLVHCGRVGD